MLLVSKIKGGTSCFSEPAPANMHAIFDPAFINAFVKSKICLLFANTVNSAQDIHCITAVCATLKGGSNS